MLTNKDGENHIAIALERRGEDKKNKIIYFQNDFENANIKKMSVGEKQCEYCGKRYERQSSLTTHQKLACPVLKSGGEYDKKEITSVNKFFPVFFLQDTSLLVSGKRGCGKSTFCAEAIRQYHKMYPKNKIIVVSRLTEDDSMQGLEKTLRIHPNDLTEQLKLEDLKDTLIVFDDVCDSDMSKKERDKLQTFIKDCIENSRHYHNRVIITSHMAADGWGTRPLLNEASHIVFFPAYSTQHQIDYVLDKYVGMNASQRKQITKITNSRWCCVSTSFPKFVCSEHNIYLYK